MSETHPPERTDKSTYDLDPIPYEPDNGLEQELERPNKSASSVDPVAGEPDEGLEEGLERPNKSAHAVGQPLPRLWKMEPEPSDALKVTDPDWPIKKIAKGGNEDKPAPKKTSKPTAKANPPQAKARPKSTDEGDGKDKKVLIEDTPRFDTIEARQRVRLIVGGLGVFCVLVFGYVGHRILFGNASEVNLSAEEPSASMAKAAAPAGRTSLDVEARFMLNRAIEFAKAGRTDQAMGMLQRVVTSYKGTESAALARAALERPKRNLPLFPDGPVVAAERKPVEPPPAQAAFPGMNTGPRPAAPGPIAMRPPVPMGPVRQQPQPSPAQPPPARTQSAQPPPVPTQSPAQPPPVPTRSPAQPQPAQPQPAQPQPAQPQPTQPQPAAQPQPERVMPPPGPGQVVTLVPANPPGPTEMPRTVEKPEADRADIDSRQLHERKLPAGFKAKVEAGLHESGWPLVIVGEHDRGPMVLIPGGTFTMGSDHGESVEAPAHTVRLSTFYIDRYEVTNRQFRTFLDDTQYRGRPPGNWLSEERLRDSQPAAPAVFVSYRDAETFALWAGKRLPTEAQWEMAARLTDGRRFPWGDQPAKWSRPREFKKVDPVMSFPEDVSPYGVFDMSGNVLEWARDWYEPKYFQKFRDKAVENPTGPATNHRNSIQRVVKGGSKTWTVSSRQGVNLDKRLAYLGFRCTLAVEGPEASAGIAPHPAKKDAQPGAPPPGAAAPGGDLPF